MSLWLFCTVTSLLFVAAIALLYWGLWGDRARGRLRCPKCWYDMTGSVEAGLLKCPECGKDAQNEKQMNKDRRNLGLALVGTIYLLLAGYTGNVGRVRWIDQQVLQKLDTPIGVRFEHNQCEKVFAYLSNQLNIEIAVDWEQLDSIGFERSSEISLILEDVPAKKILDLILEHSAPGGYDPLGWRVRDGRVEVSRAEALRE